MNKFKNVKKDKNGVMFYSQGYLDAEIIKARAEGRRIGKESVIVEAFGEEDVFEAGRQSALAEIEHKTAHNILLKIELLMLDIDEKVKDNLDWSVAFGELNVLIEDLKDEYGVVK